MPVESGFVQYTPLALEPFIESGSPGICVNDIAAKCGMPKLLSNPFIFKTSFKAFFNFCES